MDLLMSLATAINNSDGKSIPRLSGATDAQAQYNLGCYYRDGTNGVTQDYKMAFDLFYKSALQSNSSGMLAIGAAYQLGIFHK
jgi:TPR repeat protein